MRMYLQSAVTTFIISTPHALRKAESACCSNGMLPYTFDLKAVVLKFTLKKCS